MAVEIRPSGEPLSPSQVDELELTLRTKLPEDYKALLRRYNVAEVPENVYRAGDITTSIEQFFGISKDENKDLVLQNREMYSGRLPARAVAIARAGGGNLICIRTSDQGIYFWNHEQEAFPDEEPGYSNMTRLADSFAEFLERLQPYRADDFPPSRSKVTSVKLKPGFAEKFKKFM